MGAARRRRRPARAPRAAGGVVLIAMPWQVLPLPSIQLGILQPLLEEAGIRAEVRSFKLDFMEHCRVATRGQPEEQRIGLADYEAVAADHYWVGLGEWIFAVPPFRETTAAGDTAYLDYVRQHGVPERDIDKALAMRALVPAFLEACVDDVLSAGPRIVGFTSTFSQTVPSLILAKMLKRADPSLTVVFGGANCDGPMGAALLRAFSWVDVIVRGEAESIMVELMRDLLGGGAPRSYPGLCYRHEGEQVVIDQTSGEEIAMDRLPIPQYGEYFERLAKTGFAAEILAEVRVPYESARGCWWGAKSHCTFCGLNGSSMAFRSKSPARALEEIETLVRRYGRLDLQAVDNIIDMRYLRDVLPRLRERGYDLSVFYETKANLRKEHVPLLRESGVDRIQPGIESLSTPILHLMRKGVTAFQNVRLLKWCAEYGLRVFWNVIYGFPGEPPEEYARMAALVPALEHLSPPTLGPLVLDRFSPYHEQPGHFGLEIAGPLPYYEMIYPADPATLNDLAYSFQYAHADGRDPDAYVAPLRRAIEEWRSAHPSGYRTLRYRRGAGFLLVQDGRPHSERANYTFDEREAALYLACADGATPAEARDIMRSAGGPALAVDEIRGFLDELTRARLVFAEGDRYLALALPWRLAEVA
jgi:ribosomal peptide maturation radical SAM protein 1